MLKSRPQPVGVITKPIGHRKSLMSEYIPGLPITDISPIERYEEEHGRTVRPTEHRIVRGLYGMRVERTVAEPNDLYN